LFPDVFIQWAAASILNDPAVNPKFGYTRDGLKTFYLAPTKTFVNLGDNVVFVASDVFKDWQSRWYNISQFAGGKSVLKINFSSPSLASFDVYYFVLKTGGSQTTSAFSPTPRSNVLYISGIGTDVNRIILMPVKKDKISGFASDETAVPLTLSFERTETISPGAMTPSVTPSPSPTPLLNAANFPLPGILDGSLIRAEGDYKVYMVSGGWRRHVVDAKIFGFYPGLGFDKVKVVSPSVLAQYRESNLIRYRLGTKVYSVDETGNRRWLNMSGAQFTASGRAWDSIFLVNLNELNFYRASSNIVE
jgi:hypothetical protein